MLVLGLGTTAAIRMATVDRGDPELAAYQAKAKPIVQAHNGLAAKWNEFVPRFNAVDEADVVTSVAVYEDGTLLTKNLVRDSQATMSQWRKLVPPAAAAESHALALRALELTQDGYIAYEDYFASAIVFSGITAYGPTDPNLAVTGNAKLREAAELWRQAQDAAASR